MAGSLVCGRELANPGQPLFAVTEMCKLLCQLPPIILHKSDPSGVHRAHVTRWIQREADEMLTSP